MQITPPAGGERYQIFIWPILLLARYLVSLLLFFNLIFCLFCFWCEKYPGFPYLAIPHVDRCDIDAIPCRLFHAVWHWGLAESMSRSAAPSDRLKLID